MHPDILSQHQLAGIISRSPLILFSGWHLNAIPMTARLKALDIRNASLLMTNYWSVEAMHHFNRPALETYIATMLDDAASGSQNVLFLCNSPAEIGILHGLGARAHLAPSNCLIDETRLQPGTHPPLFDAVYNAQMAGFKRHELAVEIDSLLLIYGVFGDDQRAYFRKVAAMLPHAAMANGDPDAEPASPAAYRRLGMEEVAAHYTMARTGLCLSQTEGTMHAAIEYLMCGLPVVSTWSLGGRDLFFPDEYSTIADANPADIARAVRQYARRPPDPAAVRQAAFRLVLEYREAFAAGLGQILAEAGVSAPDLQPRDIVTRMCRETWYGQHNSKLGHVLAAPGYTPIRAILEGPA